MTVALTEIQRIETDLDWFVKYAHEPRGLVSLQRARMLHTQFHHPALPDRHQRYQSVREFVAAWHAAKQGFYAMG